jgi:hypothetical protein
VELPLVEREEAAISWQFPDCSNRNFPEGNFELLSLERAGVNGWVNSTIADLEDLIDE